MELNYKVYLKDGVFKYDCSSHSSTLRITNKNIKQIYNILNKLDVLQEQAAKTETKRFVYNGFIITFDFSGCFAIKNFSNWLNIEKEVPIIKKELNKYIKDYDKESVKDIIIKIKSLKKGSSNRTKEELKWEKLLFQER